jgi:hypothetical protein
MKRSDIIQLFEIVETFLKVSASFMSPQWKKGH